MKEGRGGGSIGHSTRTRRLPEPREGCSSERIATKPWIWDHDTRTETNDLLYERKCGIKREHGEVKHGPHEVDAYIPDPERCGARMARRNTHDYKIVSEGENWRVRWPKRIIHAPKKCPTTWAACPSRETTDTRAGKRISTLPIRTVPWRARIS